MVKLTPEQQDVVVQAKPTVFTPVKGGWGQRGATSVRLATATADIVRAALETAWRNVAPAKLVRAGAGGAARSDAGARARSMQRPRRRGTTWAAFCRLALKLPGVERGTSYGTPALRVGKKYLARLKENRQDVAIWIDFADRDVLLELDPAAFYVTDHYRPYPGMLIRLKQVRLDLLAQVLEQAWRQRASKSLLATRERAAAANVRLRRG
jgi:hypothetical protein